MVGDRARKTDRIRGFGRESAVARVTLFALAGGVSFIVDVAGYLALVGTGIEHRLARALAFWPAVTSSWALNRALTFADRPRGHRGAQWARFAGTCLVGLSLNVGSYTALTTFVAVFDRHRLLALVAGTAVGSVANFILASTLVYPPRPTPAPGCTAPDARVGNGMNEGGRRCR